MSSVWKSTHELGYRVDGVGRLRFDSTQVVLANLTVGSERVGPHAFLVDMASPGISTGDMGIKTTGNDLDNAFIAFDGVRVPRSALLDAHCDVSADGTYARTTKGIARSGAALYRFYAIDER